MADIHNPISAAPNVIRRDDYRPPDWLVPEIALEFQLDPALTRVKAVLKVVRNGNHSRPLRLDEDGLVPLAVKVDGSARDENGWTLQAGALVIELPGDAHEIETLVELCPQANTRLMGLSASSGLLCPQCEAEGFRRITFFPARPDVLSIYSVRMDADQAAFPGLPANGDPVGGGHLDGGRPLAKWNDP